jgi:hypothetical protein
MDAETLIGETETLIPEARVRVTGHAYTHAGFGDSTTLNAYTDGYADPALNGHPIVATWYDLSTALVTEEALQRAWENHRSSLGRRALRHRIRGVLWCPASHPDGPVEVTPSNIDLDAPNVDRWWLTTTTGEWAIRRDTDSGYSVRVPGEGWLAVQEIASRLRAGSSYRVMTEAVAVGFTSSRWFTGTVISCGAGEPSGV